MNNNEIGGLYSWPAIIIAFIVFWPVGIYLLYKRVSLDKQAAMGGGKSVKTVKGLYIAAYVLGVLMIIGEEAGMGIFFIIAGVVLQRVNNNIKKKAENTKRYLSIIINGNETNLDNIAAAVNKNYETVKTEIQEMIDKEYLRNAYINESTREVVLPQRQQPVQQPVYNTAGAAPTPQKPRVVACKCCGANNTIVGAVGECEYCGSSIQ